MPTLKKSLLVVPQRTVKKTEQMTGMVEPGSWLTGTGMSQTLPNLLWLFPLSNAGSQAGQEVWRTEQGLWVVFANMSRFSQEKMTTNI